MKRTIFALLLSATTAASLYACTGDDAAVGNSNDDGGNTSDGSSNDGSFTSDTSTPDDSGTDAGLSPTSLEILAVKNSAPPTPDGGAAPPVTISLPIDHALVTYVRRAVAPDPAGFFLQAEQTGPAVFVAIDSSSLSPAPVAGDDVSMTVTSVTNVASLHEILAVSGFKINSHGNAIAPLLRHVSTSTDLVTKLDNYESEYIELDGFVAEKFGGSGGSVSAEITTAAFASPTSTLQLRLPPDVQTHFDIQAACQFSLTGNMWRFGKNAEPSGWENADLTTMECNAPKVFSAVGASPTTVNVVFDRNIGASSLLAAGSQFAITDTADAGAGPTVSGAVLQSDLRTVTLTTSTQNALEPLTVTVASTLEDVLSKGVDATHNTANFVGFVTPATLQFNEMNPNLSGATHDLIELVVLTDGNLVGTTIVENLVASKVLLATLPNLQVVAGDIVVVHLQADFPDGGVDLITNETTTKADCSLPNCFPNAWDVSDTAHGQSGMTNSTRVLAIKLPNGQIEDGISWHNNNAAATNFFNETNALIDAGMWESCGGTYCTDSDAAVGISFNFQGVDNKPAGKDVQRIGATNTHSRADWELNDAGSFGIVNTP
ncbi:MAG: hypothetical protein ABI183_09040 [Polyangiaceae bacterium]